MGKVVTNGLDMSNEEMDAFSVPLNHRDECSHILVALNECRKKNYWLPFKCKTERHNYEHCYFAMMDRNYNEGNVIPTTDPRFPNIQDRSSAAGKEQAPSTSDNE